MGLRNQKFNILVHEKPIYRGGLPNGGGLQQFADLRGKLGETRWDSVFFFFWGGGGG